MYALVKGGDGGVVMIEMADGSDVDMGEFKYAPATSKTVALVLGCVCMYVSAMKMENGWGVGLFVWSVLVSWKPLRTRRALSACVILFCV